jgi:hypothetical protein
MGLPLLRQVVQYRTVLNHDGQITTNDGGGADRPSTMSKLTTPRPIQLVPMRWGVLLAAEELAWTAFGCVPGYVFTMMVPGPCVL